MSSINDSYQDLIHGIDFTGLGTQTAAEHNQLVDSSIPFTEDVNNLFGVGLILTSIDSALNTPDVPNPGTSANYTKWKRYVWCRHIYVSAGVYNMALYTWNDSAVLDATYLKWILIDFASTTSLTTGYSTPLQTALTTVNTNAANAVATANTALTNTTSLQAATFGSHPLTVVGASNFWDLYSTTQAGQLADATNIATIFTAISGVNNTVVGSGGINGQIAALQQAVNTAASDAKLVANITPGTKAGMRIRTNASATAAEWYDPATGNDIITALTGLPAVDAVLTSNSTDTIGTCTLGVGVWLIFVVVSVKTTVISGNATENITAIIGGTTLTSNIAKFGAPSTNQQTAAPLVIMSVAAVTASGTLTVALVNTISGSAGTQIQFESANILAYRISVANAIS